MRTFLHYCKAYIQPMLALYIILAVIISMGIYVSAAPEDSREFTLIYFYTSVCKQCEEVEKFIQLLNHTSKAAGTGWRPVIRAYNITESYRMKLMSKYLLEYHVPEPLQSSPIVFAGGKYLHGEDNIRKGLEELVLQDFIPETKILILEERDDIKLRERDV